MRNSPNTLDFTGSIPDQEQNNKGSGRLRRFTGAVALAGAIFGMGAATKDITARSERVDASISAQQDAPPGHIEFVEDNTTVLSLAAGEVPITVARTGASSLNEGLPLTPNQQEELDTSISESTDEYIANHNKLPQPGDSIVVTKGDFDNDPEQDFRAAIQDGSTPPDYGITVKENDSAHVISGESAVSPTPSRGTIEDAPTGRR